MQPGRADYCFMSGGKSTGTPLTLGAAIGEAVHIFTAVLRKSAILATSAVAFTMVK